MRLWSCGQCWWWHTTLQKARLQTPFLDLLSESQDFQICRSPVQSTKCYAYSYQLLVQTCEYLQNRWIWQHLRHALMGVVLLLPTWKSSQSAWLHTCCLEVSQAVGLSYPFQADRKDWVLQGLDAALPQLSWASCCHTGNDHRIPPTRDTFSNANTESRVVLYPGHL